MSEASQRVKGRRQERRHAIIAAIPGSNGRRPRQGPLTSQGQELRFRFDQLEFGEASNRGDARRGTPARGTPRRLRNPEEAGLAGFGTPMVPRGDFGKALSI